MKAIIVSDIHGNSENFKKLISFMQSENIDKMIILGDTFNNYYELNVSSVRFHKHFAIVKFKEFQTVNDVEEFKGCDLYLSKEEVEENLANDEYLISDLIGMDVYDEDGSCVGVITAIGENLANDLLSVKDGNGKEHLVPFVKEIVPVVDLKGRKVVINNIEGLIS